MVPGGEATRGSRRRSRQRGIGGRERHGWQNKERGSDDRWCRREETANDRCFFLEEEEDLVSLVGGTHSSRLQEKHWWAPQRPSL